MTRVYKNVGSVKPGLSLFDLSYEKKFTCDMGQLIPVMCDEVVPGDIFKISNEAVIRFQPLVAPVLHEINMYVHYFFVPYRLLWDDWEDFITGGIDGQFDEPIPEWDPVNYTKGSLWDYLGFPLVKPVGALPLDFPRRAYNLVYNEYYRDETLIDEVPLTNESILNRCWEKDYFTSALPWQQRGVAPALPISGTTSAIWADSKFGAPAAANLGMDMLLNKVGIANKETETQNLLKPWFNSNVVDLSSASTFDIADLRLAFQVQRWLERNARAGARYTEFLQSHFSVSPRDERLHRPEYIGGSKSPIIVSEVLQTSSTDSTSPQGNLAGHGIGVSRSFCGRYRATEFGLIIGIMSIMPRSSYVSQGVNRQWLRKTKYDFYFPEFANLSEQAVLNAEICAKSDNAHNNGIFGYQGRYDEMRTKQSLVVSEMRDDFSYWHLGRSFSLSSPPLLNENFVKCVPRKDIFAVQNVPGLIVSFGNLIRAYRPLPVSAEPGLVDHT